VPEQSDPVAAYQLALHNLDNANRNLINALNAIHAAADAIEGEKWKHLAGSTDGHQLMHVTRRSDGSHSHHQPVAEIASMPNPEQLRDLLSARRRAFDAAELAHSAVPQSRGIGLVAPRDLPIPPLRA
jgi:hypothetical protein